MISNEIIDEVIWTSQNEEYLDKFQIERILLDVLEKLEDMTKISFAGIYFNDKHFISDENAYTDIENSTINIHLDVTCKELDEERNKNHLSYLSSNLTIIYIVLHELEHLREKHKLMISSFDKNLIKLSDMEFLYGRYLRLMNLNNSEENELEFKKFYVKTWKLNPSERIADIDSFSRVLNSINNYPDFKRKYKGDYNYIADELIRSYLLGYRESKIISSPLVSFLKSFKMLSVLNSEVFQSKMSEYLSIEEKLRYGFPVYRREIIKFKRLVKEK